MLARPRRRLERWSRTARRHPAAVEIVGERRGVYGSVLVAAGLQPDEKAKAVRHLLQERGTSWRPVSGHDDARRSGGRATRGAEPTARSESADEDHILRRDGDGEIPQCVGGAGRLQRHLPAAQVDPSRPSKTIDGGTAQARANSWA
jgi:hypothetical protein